MAKNRPRISAATLTSVRALVNITLCSMCDFPIPTCEENFFKCYQCIYNKFSLHNWLILCKNSVVCIFMILLIKVGTVFLIQSNQVIYFKVHKWLYKMPLTILLSSSILFPFSFNVVTCCSLGRFCSYIHCTFYVPVAYILHLLDSCWISYYTWFCGKVEI